MSDVVLCQEDDIHTPRSKNHFLAVRKEVKLSHFTVQIREESQVFIVRCLQLDQLSSRGLR